MENVMQGATSCTNSQAPKPDCLAVYRTAIEGLLATSEHISDQEYQTAAHRVNACKSLETLQKWYRSCVREIARREEEQPAPAVYATVAQYQEIVTLLNHVAITRQEKTKTLLTIQQLDGTQAVALIGNLYQKVLDRTGKSLAPHAVATPAAATIHLAR